MPETDRYARQRLVRWWDQARLRAARVLVGGAGALGNELLKNLALLGVGRLVVIDFDRIEHSNLSRTVLFREADVGRPKAEVAAEAVARLNPEVQVRAVVGDLFYDVGLGQYRHSALAVGCLDNLAARAQMGLCCALAGIPFLDGGMWSLGGEARWFLAGEGPCFDCTLAADDRARADERRSCSGFRAAGREDAGPAATLASTAAIIGGLLAQEAAKWLCGQPVAAGRALVYNGQALTLHRAELPRNPDCLSAHRPYEAVFELPRGAEDLTPRELLARAGGEGLRLELGRDFLWALHCDACGRRQEVGRPLGLVVEGERTCPHCGAVRRAEVVRSLDGSSPYLDVPLARLGVPPAEVLAVHGDGGLRLFELTADV
jgi:adenylyltransferase/sulfurtransferase